MKTFIWMGVIVVLLLLGGSWWSRSLSESDPNVLAVKGLHWHPQLEIYMKGEKVEIPQNVGLGAVHNPLHTHDDLPVLHMEFEGKVTLDDTKLGNFFQIWGKEFSAENLMGNENGPDGRVSMTVNGAESTEFENYHMHDGDKIVIRYE